MNQPLQFPHPSRRLARSVKIIEVLEQRRAITGDENLGSNIERMIVERELEELEEQIYRDPGPLAPHLTPVSLRRKSSVRGW